MFLTCHAETLRENYLGCDERKNYKRAEFACLCHSIGHRLLPESRTCFTSTHSNSRPGMDSQIHTDLRVSGASSETRPERKQAEGMGHDHMTPRLYNSADRGPPRTR